MVSAVFPNSLASWTDRRDELDVVFANDPNSIAAEVAAVELALGTNPHVEKNPIIPGPSGTVVYNNVDARISDVLNGGQIPVCYLTSDEQLVHNNQPAGANYGEWNSYGAQNVDPFNMYNGVDITIPVSGWWHVNMSQYWDWWSTGYHGMWFWVDGFFHRNHHWQWDFPGNELGGYWYRDVFTQRPTTTHIEWEGPLQAGQRIRVLSENGCPHTPHRAYNMSFAASFVRKLNVADPTTIF